MSHSYLIKQKAIQLRKRGTSLKEISEKLNIAKSTASVWLQDILLSSHAQDILTNKQQLGHYKTILKRKKLREAKKQLDVKNAVKIFKSLNASSNTMKIYCALLWWCEGNKETRLVKFTNSDPTLIKNFLLTLRSGFSLDESKFRVLIHLHEYHNESTQKTFWTNVTKIPLTQFHKSYLKPHTGKRQHPNYQGCIAVTYYDAKIAKELEALYNAFTLTSGGVR